MIPFSMKFQMARRLAGFVPAALALSSLSIVLFSEINAQDVPTSAPSSSESLVARSLLLPGDALQIRIWLEPDLSGEFVVDEEGVVTLPMLGRISAVDLSIAELRALLIDRYTKELRNPSITVTPVRRVYVLGEVNRPGMYGLDPTASLASAVALAGGANREGDLRKLTLIRENETFLSGVDPMADLLSTGTRSGDQIFVERRSWLERNQQFVTTTVLGVAGIAVALINR
jgi:protein involved in polysaccharide export with SLBB domain